LSNARFPPADCHSPPSPVDTKSERAAAVDNAPAAPLSARPCLQRG